MKLTAMAFLSLLGIKAAAQKNETLDPVTVTATLKPQGLTGRNITVIPGEQFSHLPVQSLDELLKFVPGVEVQQRGAAGSQADIVLRGGTFQQVLVILDGLRLNDPNTGHFSSYFPIAPSEIDHIEILKGAASAIYGSEAVGGVIHIITKSFAAKQNEPKKSLSLSAIGGEYGLWSANTGGNWQTNNSAFSGGVLTNNADGQPQRGTNGSYHNTTASLSASHYFNSHWQLSLRSAFDRRHFSAQNFYTTYTSDTATEAVETFWNQASLGYHKGKNAWITEAGYKQATDQYAFNSAISPNKNISQLAQVNSRYEHQFTNATALITGMQYQNKSIRSNDRGNHTLDQVAGFAMLNQTFGKLFLSPAIRADYTSGIGTEMVPQLSVGYKLSHLQLRANAGKTIRNADFTERYNNYNKALVTSGSIGNPDLQAERSFSYEIGADWFIKSQWRLSAGLFRRDQSNLIDWVTTAYAAMPRKVNLSPAGTYALAQNISRVHTSGAEMDVQWITPLINQHQLTATLGMVWLDSESPSGQPSFYLSSHAKFLANVSTVYTCRFGSVSLTGIYKTRAAQNAGNINASISKDYFLMNTRITGFVRKQKAGIFIEAQNLFNITYSDLLGAPMPGRWLSAGFTLSLK